MEANMTFLKRACGLVLALALVLGLQAVAYAQTGAASITGLVTDTSGAVAPGVTVVATNQATNVQYTAVSNQAGNYDILSVPVGTYVVKATLSGFKTTTLRPMALEAKQIARVDLRMEVGALEDTVEVTAQSPVLQTESATVGEVLSGRTVESLPLNGRNSSQLALLMPGAVTPNPQAQTSSGGYSARPFINGNREQTNNFLVDGIDMNETVDNRVAYQPSPDALAEISVETNNYAADIGNVAGGVISNVIKSGSNQFRGNAFEFYRTTGLNANSWANNRSGAKRPELTQHIFGATFGGPIIKNKLFFFVDYQGTVRDQPGQTTASVAPAAWRTGDLSSLLPGTVIKDPVTGVAFPNNQIPLGRISPTALAILNDPNYPLPNRTVTGVTGNYVGDTLTTTRANQGDLRLDWNASANDKLFLRFSLAEYELKGEKTAFPFLLGSLTQTPFRNLAANWSHVFSPSLINEVLVGYNSINNVNWLNDWGGIGDANATFGIPGGQPLPGLSAINWGSGLNNIGAAATLEDNLPKGYQINDKVTWIKGRHSLKIGGQFLRYVQRRYYAGNNGALGSFNYGGTFTGFAFSDFLLDQVSNKGRGGGDRDNPWTHLTNRISLYVQDDFRIRPDLTLNLGLRWAYSSPFIEKDNRQSNFDVAPPLGSGTGVQTFAKDGSTEDRALYKPYYNGWEPRLGFAWRPTDRWVVRGGYGISQYMEGTGSNLRLPMNPPFFFESNVVYDTSTGPGTITTGFAELVPGTTPTGNVRAFDPNLRPQFTQQWNVFVERMLTSSMSVNVGYVGHHATHLVAPVEGNQPLPGTGDPATWAPLAQRRPLYQEQPLITTIATTASVARSNYNALQASVRQRAWHGLEFMASYTFGKVLTNNLGYYGSGFTAGEGAYWMNAYEPEWNYGRAFFDVRHNFVLAFNYELPFGKGMKWGSEWGGLTDAILGGWKVSAIMQARTGIPLTIRDVGGRTLQAVRGNERPNCVGNPVPSNQGMTSDPNAPNDSKWIDIAAFQSAPIGTWGNCGIGIMSGPGYSNVDLTLAKRFNMGGTRQLELRAEAFNALNHPNWNMPGVSLASPNTFGIITSTVNEPRIMQLAVKFYF
jgi:hypothetical protein